MSTALRAFTASFEAEPKIVKLVKFSTRLILIVLHLFIELKIRGLGGVDDSFDLLFGQTNPFQSCLVLDEALPLLSNTL
jgi:hypothetical protein